MYSRLSRRLTLGALTLEDTAEYVRTRLAKAGVSREVFTADAIAPTPRGRGWRSPLTARSIASPRPPSASAAYRKKLVERDILAHVLEASSDT